jgi:hypothetical protein
MVLEGGVLAVEAWASCGDVMLQPTGRGGHVCDDDVMGGGGRGKRSKELCRCGFNGFAVMSTGSVLGVGTLSSWLAWIPTELLIRVVWCV